MRFTLITALILSATLIFFLMFSPDPSVGHEQLQRAIPDNILVIARGSDNGSPASKVLHCGDIEAGVGQVGDLNCTTIDIVCINCKTKLFDPEGAETSPNATGNKYLQGNNIPCIADKWSGICEEDPDNPGSYDCNNQEDTGDACNGNIAQANWQTTPGGS